MNSDLYKRGDTEVPHEMVKFIWVIFNVKPHKKSLFFFKFIKFDKKL